MSGVHYIDGDITQKFNQKYRNMMPVDVNGVYSPNTLDCHVGPTNNARNHLYTVITEDNQFYVGITGRAPVERWKEHLGEGYYEGAEFLKGKEIAAFILVRRRMKNAEEAEDKLTLQLMAKYGVDNVNGGEYAVDRSPGRDLPLLRNPSEYDFLSDVDLIESEPIPSSEAHPSVKNSTIDQLITIIIIPFYLIYAFIVNIPTIIFGLIGLSIIAFIVISVILIIISLIIAFIDLLLNQIV